MSPYLSILRGVRVRKARLCLAATLALVLGMRVNAAAKDQVPWKGSAIGKVTSSAARPDGSTLIDVESLGHGSLLGETSTNLRFTSCPGTGADGKPIATLVGDGTLHASNGDKVYIA